MFYTPSWQVLNYNVHNTSLLVSKDQVLNNVLTSSHKLFIFSMSTLLQPSVRDGSKNYPHVLKHNHNAFSWTLSILISDRTSEAYQDIDTSSVTSPIHQQDLHWAPPKSAEKNKFSHSEAMSIIVLLRRMCIHDSINKLYMVRTIHFLLRAQITISSSPMSRHIVRHHNLIRGI